MAFPYNLKLLDERHVSTAIEHLLWSPKMDLLLLANSQGDVMLHRLSWQKVWHKRSIQEGVQVCSLAWRPDGRVAAVGYGSGQLVLLNIETAEVLHQHELGDAVVSLHWIENSDQSMPECCGFEYINYLPSLPALPNRNGTMKQDDSGNDYLSDFPESKTSKNINVLVAGTAQRTAYMFALGMFLCGFVTFENSDKVLQHVFLTKNFSQLIGVLVPEDAGLITVYQANTEVLHNWRVPIFLFAGQHSTLLHLCTYIQNTIQAIHDAWEDVLLDMDAKLEAYARSCPGGSASADFLDLLMFGTASDQLTSFLLQQLNMKALKKTGHALELSYTNIQKLLLHHLQPAGHHLLLRLQHLHGLGRMYPVLGLELESLVSLRRAAETFLCKTLELQQLIDSSVRSLQAFYRWVHGVILRMAEDSEPEPSHLTQQDLSSLAIFLDHHFSKYEQRTSDVPCSLDKVGQYLQDADLPFLPRATSPWAAFLKTVPELQDIDMIFVDEPRKSLVQKFNSLQKSLHQILTQATASLQANIMPPVPILTDRNLCGDSVRATFLDPYCALLPVRSSASSDLFILNLKSPQEVQGLCVAFSHPELQTMISKLQPIDVGFYSAEQLFVLLGNSTSCVLLHFPLGWFQQFFHPVSSYFAQITDIQQPLSGASLKKLDSWNAHSFAVSGLRKVIAILFKTQKRLRLYETEVEEEEEIFRDSINVED